jgi:glycosyltransferase involved in cell wall biosynthesis
MLIKMSQKYDIVHAQYGSAVGFLTSFTRGTRILSLKGSDWYNAPNPSIFHKVRVFVGGLLTSFSINRFHHIIVMSDTMKQQVLAKFPNATVETIVDPIDLKKFKAQAVPKKEDTKKVLFASVNINNPIKQFPLAKKSFELLRKRIPNSEFVTMSNIPHNEVCAFMNSMDVLLLTSTHEGWPNVVKEMLALDKPFVSTKVSDLEAIASQTNSCYVCEDDPEELSNSLYKSLNAPKENLRHLVKDFNMEESLARIVKIYKSYV